MCVRDRHDGALYTTRAYLRAHTRTYTGAQIHDGELFYTRACVIAENLIRLRVGKWIRAGALANSCDYSAATCAYVRTRAREIGTRKGSQATLRKWSKWSKLHAQMVKKWSKWRNTLENLIAFSRWLNNDQHQHKPKGSK